MLNFDLMDTVAGQQIFEEGVSKGSLRSARENVLVAHYMVVIEKGENNFSAYSLDVPGCITTGKTLEETLENMEDALCFHLEGLYEDGDPLPEPRNPEDHIREIDAASGGSGSGTFCRCGIIKDANFPGSLMRKS